MDISKGSSHRSSSGVTGILREIALHRADLARQLRQRTDEIVDGQLEYVGYCCRITSSVMTSGRKIAANRRNSRQSTGPRFVQAKQRIRRNALRHGFRAIALSSPAISAEVDRLATAIRGKGADPADREQALIIAESELVLLRVRAARIDLIERMVQEPDGTRSASVTRQQPANNLSCLKQLMTLDGYERRALSRRKRGAIIDVTPVVAS